MRSIFAGAPKVSFVYEAFGGLGRTARTLAERFAGVHILSADLDQGCVDSYNQFNQTNMYLRCVQMDARALLNSITHLPADWGATLDFNRFTIMDVQGRKEGRWKIELINAVMARRPQPRWVQVTDSAVRYLHLNAHRYGCDPEPKDYIRTLGRAMKHQWGLKLVGHSHYYAASYLLLTPS